MLVSSTFVDIGSLCVEFFSKSFIWVGLYTERLPDREDLEEERKIIAKSIDHRLTKQLRVYSKMVRKQLPIRQ